VVICEASRVMNMREHDTAHDINPLPTGSVAEFHIDPMLPCVGDVDIMFHLSCQLAIPQGHQPPRWLPRDFRGRVHVYEIIDSK